MLVSYCIVKLTLFLSFCLLSVALAWPQVLLAIVGVYSILLTSSEKSDCINDGS